jgi:Ca-activated chloride channel family protein
VTLLPAFRFADPWHLTALLLVALAVAVRVWRTQRRQDPVVRISAGGLVRDLPKTAWVRLRWLPDVLRWLALTLFALALARPQTVADPDEVDTEGIDIMVVLDVSGSMRAADFQPKDRMFVAKKSVAEFVRQRSRDRIGLVVFAGEASLWVPLTLDYGLLLELLSEVETGMLPGGTAIGTALGTALGHLEDSEAESRVVVLITDGESNAGNITPKQAAELAEELGVSVYTVAIGTGGVVPVPAGRDMFGRTVMRQVEVPVDRELLEDIAASTGGQAFVATDAEALDAGLSRVLDALDRSQLRAGISERVWQDRWMLFIGVALALLALELVLRATRLERFP